MKDKKMEEIKKSAEEIIDSFENSVKDLPKLAETHYDEDIKNLIRKDGVPDEKNELNKFRKNFLDMTPSHNSEGNIEVEVAEWSK